MGCNMKYNAEKIIHRNTHECSPKMWRHASRLVNYARYRCLRLGKIQLWPCAPWHDVRPRAVWSPAIIWMMAGTRVCSRVTFEFAREPRSVTADRWHNVSNEISWMVRPEPVAILDRIKTGDQSSINVACHNTYITYNIRERARWM